MACAQTAAALLIGSLLAACGGGGGGGGTPDSAPPVATTGLAATTSGSTGTSGTADSPPAATPTPAAAASAAAPAPAGSNPAAGTPERTTPQPTPVAAVPPSLLIRAAGTLVNGIGPILQVRIDGQPVASLSIQSTEPADYRIAARLNPGARLDLVFVNDAVQGSADRNVFIAYLDDGQQVVLPTASGATLDYGEGDAAFDGQHVLPGRGDIYTNAALRLVWPAPAAEASASLAPQRQAARFLMQASFGPTQESIDAVVGQGIARWIDAQIAMPAKAEFVPHVQARFDRGADWRPGGSQYTPVWVGEKFWSTAASAPDQLRKRVAFALHQMLMVSQADSNLWFHGRAYAQYYDTLNRLAFGNYRQLLEEVTLSPAMGIYLSHMRNRKEDPASGRMPDENFARELMQLFTIGLHELNLDGSPKRDAQGQPIETYGNADVMALAKVFTGFSWAFADNELTERQFRWGEPTLTAAADRRIDLLPMRPYPGQHSTAEKRLFAGKPWALTLPPGGEAMAEVKAALDALFHHPNVGPFVGRQLIQRLVSSHPSPAYVARVAAVFNDNGKGVRGDLAAVVRAILLDAEARSASATASVKLREPVLRVAHWMRAMGATSRSGDFMMAWDLDQQGQRALHAASVFNYFRPGYVPANTAFASRSATAPELQIVHESSVASWINTAEAMAGWGMGWTGSTSDVTADYLPLGRLTRSGQIQPLLDRLDLLLLGGRMSGPLRQAILDAAGTATGANEEQWTNRARAAVFLTLASPEYMTQP